MILRPATTDDVPRLAELLLLDAKERQAKDPMLWPLTSDPLEKIRKDLSYALTAEQQQVRQFWHVAEDQHQVVGVIHSILLPVPPIYKGRHGEPGLILSDSFVLPEAPQETIDQLVKAAEHALTDAGAQILLASFVSSDGWLGVFNGRGYDPLTLYLAKSSLEEVRLPLDVRPATEADVPGIVSLGSLNREMLCDINSFWEAHPEADTRFSGWMKRSLGMPDRDMFVTGEPDGLTGYVIAQPASRLHFPPAHSISETGVLDDFFHLEWADSKHLCNENANAQSLLRAAEAAFGARGNSTAVVVCPAQWQSKIDFLEAAGYQTVMVWAIKR